MLAQLYDGGERIWSQPEELNPSSSPHFPHCSDYIGKLLQDKDGLYLHPLQKVQQCLAQKELSFWTEIQTDKKMTTDSSFQLWSSFSASGEMRKLTMPPIPFSVQWQLISIRLTSTPNQICDLGTHIC